MPPTVSGGKPSVPTSEFQPSARRSVRVYLGGLLVVVILSLVTNAQEKKEPKSQVEVDSGDEQQDALKAAIAPLQKASEVDSTLEKGGDELGKKQSTQAQLKQSSDAAISSTPSEQLQSGLQSVAREGVPQNEANRKSVATAESSALDSGVRTELNSSNKPTNDDDVLDALDAQIEANIAKQEEESNSENKPNPEAQSGELASGEEARLDSVPLPQKEEAAAEENPILPDLEDEGTSEITGVVFGPTGEALAGVSVSIPRLELTTRADENGRFSFSDLPAGELVLQFIKLGYKRGSRTVTLKDGQELEVSQALEEQPVEVDDEEYELEAVDVVAELVEEEEKTAIEIEKIGEGLKLQGVVGRAEFTQKNLRDASDAVEKVSGANIVDGGRAVVRGLADRYVTTLFNGNSVSTSSPFRKAVSLELFPTSGVEDISVNKVYNSTLPGDFGGATIDITPRRFPEERVLDFQIRTSFDEVDAGDDFLVNSGSGLDFSGEAPFENFVDLFFESTEAATPEEETAGLLNTIQARSFLPQRSTQRPDLSFSLNYGDSFEIGPEGRLGVVYSLSRSSEDSAILDSFRTNVGSGTFNANRFSRQVTWNQSLGLTWQLNRSNELAFNYFSRANGEDRVSEIFNFSGGFSITPAVLTSGQIFENGGNNVVELVGGNFLGTQFIENTYDILRVGGRHKIFGHDLDSEEGALLEWSLSRSENEITAERSTFRRLELDFNSPGVIAAASPLDITLDEFALSPDLFAGASGNVAGDFVLTGNAFLDGFFPNRTLTAAEFAQITTFSELEQALIDAGASAATLASFESIQQGNFDSTQVTLQTDPSLGTQFTIEDGQSPSNLDSFRETSVQFERTENAGIDLSFPFKFGGAGDSKLVLRTGADFERRLRVENTEEIRIQLPLNADVDGFAVGADPDAGFEAELTDGDPNDIEILPFVSDAGENLIRSGELEQTIASLYGDAEWSWSNFVVRVGARREVVTRNPVIPALGGAQPSSSVEANLFGASASYTTSNGINFLAAYSTTVARPIVKELLPFPQIDRETGETLIGSADLAESSITNVDFAVTLPKVSGFSGQVNVFQKTISDPILRFRSGSTTIFGNGEEGTLAGVELEGKLDLPFGFSWDANYAFIQGDLEFVSFEDGATLNSTFPEQPSQIFNTSLSYSNEEFGLNANLSLNIVSSFVEQLPSNAGAPFLERQSSPKLDFSITKRFELEHADVLLGFSIDNILSSDDEILFVTPDSSNSVNGTVETSVDVGRRFSLWGKIEF